MQRRTLTYDRLLLPLSLCVAITLPGCLTEVEPAEVGFEPVLVVQSFPQPGKPVTVSLTKTRPLWDPSSLLTIQTSPTDSFQEWDKAPLLVTGAEVNLVINEMDAYVLREDSAGYYSLPPEVYLPAPEDRLVLTITADGLSVRAKTVIPLPAQDLAFKLETMPVEEEIFVFNLSDQIDTTFTLTQRIETSATFIDLLGQDDFYLLDLRFIYEQGSQNICSGQDVDEASGYDLIRDLPQPGAALRVSDAMRLQASFNIQQYPRPEDRFATCKLRARFVQYGSQYDRFLAIDYDPINGESGTNVEGGLGLFTGIVVRDTTMEILLVHP